MEFIAAVITIVAGYFGAGLIGLPFNWPEAGTVTAIAVMGGFIIHKIDEIAKK